MQIPGPATTASAAARAATATAATASATTASASARALHPSATQPRSLSSAILEDIARGIATGLVLDDPAGVDLVEPDGHVARHLVLATDAYDAWIMVWGPRAATDAHDHDGSIGVVHVVEGRLVEARSSLDDTDRRADRVLGPGDTGATAALGAHALRNPDHRVAVAVTVYSPPLRPITVDHVEA